MFEQPKAWQLADELRQNRVAIAVFFGLFGFLFLWVKIFGVTERARYVAPQAGGFHEDGVLLRTEPPSNYLMPRGEAQRALKPNCIYSFNIEVEIGANRHPNRIKRVRRATLVRC
jgi:hypothetical protein